MIRSARLGGKRGPDEEVREEGYFRQCFGMSGHDKFNQRVLGHVGLCVKSDRISERRLVVLRLEVWPVFRIAGI